MGVANMSERTIETMERNNERLGNLRMAADARNQGPLRKAVAEAMKELGANNDLYDVREELCKDVLYFDGTMSAKLREQLLTKLAEKTGRDASNYSIVALYY